MRCHPRDTDPFHRVPFTGQPSGGPREYAPSMRRLTYRDILPSRRPSMTETPARSLIRRLVGAFAAGLVGFVGVSCSSNGATSPGRGGTPSTAISTTTTTDSGPSVGSLQTAMNPAGEKVSAVAGMPQATGEALGGPKGSWVMGFVVDNIGPSDFQLTPSSQVSVVDDTGRTYAAVAGRTTTTGQPTSVAVGRQVQTLLYFLLAPGAKPRTVDFAPFGSSVPPLRWRV